MKTTHKARRRKPCERWPHGPRYTTGAVTGFRIMGSNVGRPTTYKRGPKTVWHVFDAAYGYQRVAVFHDHRILDRYDGKLFRRKFSQSAELAARQYARILNRIHKEALQ